MKKYYEYQKLMYSDWFKKYMNNHHNNSNGNSGNTSIETGDAHAEVTIHNMASRNWLSM